MKLEVIVTSKEDAQIAENAGADRLELCSALSEGGLTPSLGLIEEVVRSVDIPVHVIVRPHSQSFVYSKTDIQVMLADITYSKNAGAAGVVIGALNEATQVDTANLELLLKAADGLNVTFHRAFDEITDQLAALDVLSQFPAISRILTSGGKSPAPQSISQIKRLTEKAEKTSLTILAGNGMTPSGLSNFIKSTGVSEVHFGSGVRHNTSYLHPIDPVIIKYIQSQLHDL